MMRFGTQADPAARSRGVYRALMGVAAIAGLVSAWTITVLIINLHEIKSADPLHAPELLAKREALHQSPTDVQLKQEIRELDRELRGEFFTSQTYARRGLWVLLPALVVMITCLKLAQQQRQTPPMPNEPSPDAATSPNRGVRWGVGALGIVAIGVTGAVIYNTPRAAAPSDGAPVAAAPIPPIEGTWPSFRGPGGSGVATYSNMPIEWDGATGKNIAWKTPIPLGGFNSAVAAGGKVFCTGASKTRRAVFAFDARTGRKLWQHDVNNLSPRDAEPPEVMEETGFAAPTAATDGQRVYAIFATGDLVACDMDGNRLWGKALGVPDNGYGYANSLIAFGGNVIVQYDQGYDDDDLSAIIAFDGQTGKEAWRAARKTCASWASPVLIQTPAGPQLIALAEPWITATNPSTGEEIWRCEGVSGDVAITPFYAGGKVIVVNPSDRMFAIKPDGQGDVSKTHVLWEAFDGIPDIASPVSDGKYIYLMTTFGTMTCARLEDGQTVWEHDFEATFHSSPTVVGDTIQVTSVKGVTFVIRPGEGFEQIGRNELGEGVFSSPAFIDGHMIIRGDKHMIAIAGPAGDDGVRPVEGGNGGAGE